MKLLITGAAGFLGKYVVSEACARGHHVVALTRSSVPSEWSGVDAIEVLHCDLAVEGDLSLSGMGVDAVVHLAASLRGDAQQQRDSTIGGTSNLFLAMQQAGIHKLIGISSMSVLDYDAMPAMSVVDEHSPINSDAQGLGLYASVKLEQEEMFADFAGKAGDQCVIFRPGLIYDERHIITAHAGILKGPLKLFVSHAGQAPVVSAHSVADAILRAIEQEVSGGEIFQLVDDNLPNQQQYIEALCRRNLIGAGGLTIPWRVLKAMISVLNGVGRLTGLTHKLPEVVLPKGFAARLKPFRFSNTKAKSMLNWSPDNSFH